MQGLKIDKTNWEKVTLGDVVYEPKEAAKNVATEGFKNIVGLEHIDSDDIHLRKSFSGDADTTFTKVFRKDDVLFGRRRAYLKKAAKASFDGICSGDITVLRANKNIEKNLLPFIIHNERFFDYAIKHSAGGLSPRVKFKDLANYEFLLPPKAQQVELAKLLWTMDDLIEKDLEVIDKLEDYIKVSLGKKLNNTQYTYETIEYFIKENIILSVQDGNHGDLHPKSSDYVEDGIPFIMANTISNGLVNLKKSQKLPKSITDKLRIGFATTGDVLISHKGTIGNVAYLSDILNYEYVMLTPQVTYYRTNSKYLLPKYLYYYFQSNAFQTTLKTLSSQSTRDYIGIQAQQKIKISIPEKLNDQQQIIKYFDDLNSNLINLRSRMNSLRALRTVLLNQIF